MSRRRAAEPVAGGEPVADGTRVGGLASGRVRKCCGHRKVWARLRRERGVYTSRKRVLRLTREAGLLGPHGAGAQARRAAA
jgi:hypothetical protein